MGDAFHVETGLRDHRRKYRISDKHVANRLATALKTLEDNEEAMVLALDRTGCETPAKTSLEVRAALRFLVTGR